MSHYRVKLSKVIEVFFNSLTTNLQSSLKMTFRAPISIIQCKACRRPLASPSCTKRMGVVLVVLAWMKKTNVLRGEPEIEPVRHSGHGLIDSSGSTNGWTWWLKNK